MDDKLKIIVIDDEFDAVELLENIIKEKEQEFELVASTTKPIEGISLINKLKPDIVFLDIEMPKLNGFNLLEALGDFSFQLVFVTAYEQYALQALKNNALDYILKPVSAEEVFEALVKAKIKIQEQNLSFSISEEFKNTRMVVPTSFGYDFIDTELIIRLEADGSYTNLILKDGRTILISKTLKDIETGMRKEHLFRSHRSHIINILYIKRYEKSNNKIIMIDDAAVPISRSKLIEFKNMINSRFGGVSQD
ncbi:MAG: LytTR family DNA-binding domain-containing protein [Marinifilaceae bacterium]|jgi:two-component system LytT family response regulator|nr:LytTR family DNA-binding domain-containing protein [Marinifilaceae bacterium]